MKKRKKCIPHPIIFNEVRISDKRKGRTIKSFKNYFYKDTKFTPIPFYKIILKL